MTTQTATTITLGARELELSMPSSAAVQIEIMQSAATVSSVHRTRLVAASIGLTCKRVERMTKVTFEGHGYDLIAYGGAMFDALIDAGVPLDDVLTAGAIALGFVAENNRFVEAMGAVKGEQGN